MMGKMYLNNERIIHILWLAKKAGINPDRYGLTFLFDEASDDDSSDGGPPTTGWYKWFVIWAGGLRVMSSHGGVEVNGPWCNDLNGVLASIEEEAEMIIAQRKVAESNRLVRLNMEAKDAEERKLLDAISLYEHEKWVRP